MTAIRSHLNRYPRLNIVRSLAIDRKVLEEADVSQMIVKIPTGRYATTDFDLTSEDQDWLHSSGYGSATELLNRWSLEHYVSQRTQPTG